MPKRTRRRVYLDAGVIGRYLVGRSDVDLLAAIMEDATSKDGSLELITSTISIAEVAYLDYGDGESALNEEELSLLEDFWNSPYMTLVESNEVAMRHARDLLRTNALRNGWPKFKTNAHRRSIDYAHLGTAVYAEVKEVWSYDTDILSAAPLMKDIIVCGPNFDRDRSTTQMTIDDLPN